MDNKKLHENYRNRILTEKTEQYLKLIDDDILRSLSSAQKLAIMRAFQKITSAPSPKIVDLRFTIDLIITRYYVVIFVGKDRRKKERRYVRRRASKLANIIVAIIILISFNLFIISTILVCLYLLKSILGIDIFSGNISDVIKSFFSWLSI